MRRLIGKICAALALAAVFGLTPITLKPSATSGVSVSVDQAQAYTRGHYRRVHRRVHRRAYRRHYYYGHRNYYHRPYYRRHYYHRHHYYRHHYRRHHRYYR